MLFERSLVFVQKTLIDFEQKVQKLRLHKYHAISKVFRVWESFPEVRIRKETEIGLSGFANGRLGVGATHVMELDSVVVEVVEDSQTILGASPSIWLRTTAASETPGVLSLSDPLGPAVLPGESPLVRAQPATSPEVGGAVSSNLSHEVLGLVPRVKRHDPHPPLGAVGPGGRVAEAVPAFPP